MRKILIAAALAAVTIGLSGCSVPQPATAPLKEKSVKPSPSPSKSGPTSLTGTAPVGPTLDVKISGIKRDVTNEYGYPANSPYVVFTVSVTNKGSAAVDPMAVMISCAYGDKGTVSDDVYYDGQPAPPTVKILPGKSSTFTKACSLPKDESLLQIQAADMLTGESAVFQGDVK